MRSPCHPSPKWMTVFVQLPVDRQCNWLSVQLPIFQDVNFSPSCPLHAKNCSVFLGFCRITQLECIKFYRIVQLECMRCNCTAVTWITWPVSDLIWNTGGHRILFWWGSSEASNLSHGIGVSTRQPSGRDLIWSRQAIGRTSHWWPLLVISDQLSFVFPGSTLLFLWPPQILLSEFKWTLQDGR